MSTFYVLPSRPAVGARLAAQLEALFPGLHWDAAAWAELADGLAATLARHPDVFVVYREEVPEGEDLAHALADGFGAEPGDEVVEVQAAAAGTATGTRWRLAGPPKASRERLASRERQRPE